MFKIKVTDSKSEFYGQTLKGSCLYYDVKHTGSSDNLYIAKTEDGREIKLLSSQIDEEYYHKQELETVFKEIGAKIGDKVIILKGGSGSYSRDWKDNGEHIITDINYTGHVTFDDGKAVVFRPKVKVVCS